MRVKKTCGSSPIEGLFEEDNGIEQLTAFIEEKGFIIAESETKNPETFGT